MDQLTDDGAVNRALGEAVGDLRFEEDATELLLDSLDGDPGPTTFGDLKERFSKLMASSDAADLLLSLIGEPASEGRLEEAAADFDDPEAFSGLIRRWRAWFGDRLNEAFIVWLENPEDWKLVRSEPLYSYINQRVTVKVVLTKYGGEEVSVESTPTSLTNLIAHLTGTLSSLPAGENIMDPDAVARWVESATAFADKFTSATVVPGADAAPPLDGAAPPDLPE